MPRRVRAPARRRKYAAWFAGRLPGDWFTGRAEIVVDREEITIVGTLAAPERGRGGGRRAVRRGRGADQRFREETRGARIEIAREAEHKFRRKVAWGVTCADTTEMFTTLSVPVMTRLRQPERRVLDTLVERAWRAAAATRWPGACG